jgi:hypothetical protein
VAQRKFQWIVLDMEDLGNEWLPMGVRDKILAAYTTAGIVPGMEPFAATPALKPTTGAAMRPLHTWQSRTLAAQSESTPPTN